ncbi:DUF2652 domain-containing protein [Pedobacter aquae]|uniref:DUF2652 domain-containing protein n=1 Tax=Pedobacter aquae TaxID=2605747 RepID=A0A5C0VLH2_9SPHI|nr:DUF2652 domain-containing protein [Pedobacter aquae]QEK51824.1 DUF2652 domain-containing protein [Pedobacter aquae]
MVKTNSKIPVFFCIPDITGFTKFMMSANQDFAHEVIPNILQTIIKTNILELNVAEIEGDAIFFYKTGRLPSVQKVARQCKAIYDAFNNFIASYKEIDIQNYEKYLANNQLGIKIIIHHGKISISNIEGHIKLMGEDVILVHKLLKNSVQQHNYILLSQQYLDKLKDKKVAKNWFNWDKLQKGKDSYEHFGSVPYHYIAFADVKKLSKTKA